MPSNLIFILLLFVFVLGKKYTKETASLLERVFLGGINVHNSPILH